MPPMRARRPWLHFTALGAPLVPEVIDCIDCGSAAHLLTKVDETGRFWPGDLVTYRCEDCLDRWDLIVPGEDGEADDDLAL